MIRLAVALLALAAVLLVGCGETERDVAASAATPSAPEASDGAGAVATPSRRRNARRGRKVGVVESQFGTILADGRGQAFYAFDRERRGKSDCYGACARAWPPVLTKGRPVAGKGARKALLGTTRRRSGKRQVTYGGRALYYYVDDAPGRVLCHNVLEFGGLWLVIKPDGEPVR